MGCEEAPQKSALVFGAYSGRMCSECQSGLGGDLIVSFTVGHGEGAHLLQVRKQARKRIVATIWNSHQPVAEI